MAEFLAEWWWIDRWRKSTAYTDMTLAEQGAYRNLIDELWLRGGAIPAEDRILAKVSGAGLDWPKVRSAVLARFYSTPEGWRNETHDEVADQSRGRRDFHSSGGKARADGAERDSGGKFTSTVVQHAGGAAGEKDQHGDQPPTPDPDQTPEPDPEPKEAPPSPEEIRLAWNEVALRHSLAKVQSLSGERRRILEAFAKEAGTLDVARGACEAAASCYAEMPGGGRNFGLFNLARPANRQKWIAAAAEAGPEPWSPGKEGEPDGR